MATWCGNARGPSRSSPARRMGRRRSLFPAPGREASGRISDFLVRGRREEEESLFLGSGTHHWRKGDVQSEVHRLPNLPWVEELVLGAIRGGGGGHWRRSRLQCAAPFARPAAARAVAAAAASDGGSRSDAVVGRTTRIVGGSQAQARLGGELVLQNEAARTGFADLEEAKPGCDTG